MSGTAESTLPVLAVNAGSTSVKVSTLRDGRVEQTWPDLDAALADVSSPAVVLHRVVHGGDRTEPVAITDDVLAELRRLTELVPLHQPPALDAIERCRARFPDVPQIACFDTAFHATVPPAARTYALPARLRSRVRGFGFHGLSHAWASRLVRTEDPGADRILVAHLGGGQSVCGVLAGRSVATSMGFTPVDGLVMATRSGSVDPGAMAWLAEHTDESLSDVIERESGLLALAGTADMREVVERAADGDAEAGFAFEVWSRRLVEHAGSVIAVLGGLDAIAFTGGIGEHSPTVRLELCERLRWLGVRLDEGSRRPIADGLVEVTGAASGVRIFVVTAQEDLQMWRDWQELR